AAALDEAGDANAVIAAIDQLSVEAHLLGPAKLGDAAVERAGIVTAVALGLAETVIGYDRGQPGRHLRGRNEVAAADVEAVEAEVVGCQINEPLAEEGAFEATGPAEGAGRRLVAHHGVRVEPQVRHPIRPGEELGHIAYRRGAVRPHIGADVDED